MIEPVSRLRNLQGFASRGAGGICLEATAVVPEGRISPEDAVRLLRIANDCITDAASLISELFYSGLVDGQSDSAAATYRELRACTRRPGRSPARACREEGVYACTLGAL